MNFGKFDMVILVVMSIGIVVMSFVFPALGLTETATDESDIPSFDMNSSRFDFAGEFPDRPGTPATGVLDLDTSQNSVFSNNQRWLNGNDQNGTELLLVQNATTEDARLILNDWDGGGVTDTANTSLSSVGDRAMLTLKGYEIRFDLLTRQEGTGDDVFFEVEYEIVEQPETGGGWLGRLPLVGTVFDTASAVAGVLSWLGSILWWIFTSTWELILNLLGMLLDIVTFAFATMTWLATTYGGIIQAADSWVAVFVAIPGLLLSLEFAKLGMIAVSLLPFT